MNCKKGRKDASMLSPTWYLVAFSPNPVTCHEIQETLLTEGKDPLLHRIITVDSIASNLKRLFHSIER